jgi:hypothetical protein
LKVSQFENYLRPLPTSPKERRINLVPPSEGFREVIIRRRICNYLVSVKYLKI